MKEFITYEDLIKYIAAPLLLAVLAYWFSIRGKKREIDILKIKELNVILSNMLSVWTYLNNINRILRLTEQSEGLVFPVKFLPFFVLKSGILNDNCFYELEESVSSLKQYDPITHYELEGIGRKSEYIRRNYILPFINYSDGKEKKGKNNISRIFLDKLHNDIEIQLLNTSILISKKAKQKIENLIYNGLEENHFDIIEEFNIEYYEFIISILPDEIEKPTFEDFKHEFLKSEMQEQINKELELIVKGGLERFSALINQNPAISFEEIERILNSEN